MSGAYDGYYPSTPYAYSYGNSWRPSEPPSTYERLHTYPARRRSPTPPRRYRPYDGYHPAENNYRPNYRSDEDTTYYNRSPSPDRYSTRVQEPDTWDRSTQWNPPAKPSPWQEVTPTSPKSPVGRQRSDSMLATRMFEPSAAWKQIHTEHPVRPEAPRGHTEYQSYGSISPPRRDRSPPSHAGGDRYRPPPTYAIGRSGYDSYRPERSPVAARRRSPNQISSRHDYSNRRVSASGSIDSSVSSRARHRSPPYYGPPEVRSRSRNRPSVSHGRRSRSRSSSRHSSSRNRRSFSRNLSRSRSGRSRSRDRRSRSRGRRSRSRNPWSRSRSRSRGSSYISRGRRSPRSFKAGWNHSQASRTKVNGQDSLSPKSAQGSSWRPASRSSIASTQRSASPHAGVSQTLEMREGPQAKELDDVKNATAPSIAESTITGSAVVAEYGLSDQRLLPLQVTTEDNSLNPLPSPKVPPTQDSSNAQSNGITEASSNELGTNHSNERLTNLRPPINTPLSSPAQPFRPDSPRQHPSADEFNPPHHSLKTGPMLNGLLPGSDILLAEDLLPKERPVTSLPTPVPTPKPPLVAGTPSPPPHPEDIPNRSEAKSRAELLRIVVMTRMLCDRQTREERVDPVLTSNLAVASLARDARPSSAPNKLIKEVTEGTRSQTRLDSFNQVKGSLVDQFNKRQIALTEKTKRLKKDYLSLHRRWTAHCAQLDEQSKPPTTETEPFQTSARTTRRSMANLGDVVRSDLEMEQIIANLGNDDATDPNHLSLRNLASIPDMVSVTHGKVDYQFDDNNHLVENPAEYYGPRTGTHDWTNTEKEIFLDKFAAYPKQFGVIAEYIPNKTAAQCVDYYYLHKKTLINFRKVVLQYAPNKRRRRGTGKKRGNGLLADIRQHDAEVHRDTNSPSNTGRASRGKKTHMLPPETKEPKEARRNPNSSRRRWVPQIEGSISVGSETPTPEPEARPRRRRVAVVPTSRAVSAPFEEEEDNVEDVERPTKRVKKTRKMKSAVIIAGELTTPEPNSALEQNETITGRRKSQSGNILWSDQDKKVFLALLSQYGDDFKRIAASMPNKTTVQVSNYYKANIVDLNLEQVAATAPKRSPTPERDVRKELHIFAPHTMSSVTSTTLQASAPMSSLTPQHDPEPNPLYLNHELQTRSLLPTVPPVDASLSAIMHRYIARGYPQPVRPGLPYISNPIQLSSYPSHQAVPYTYPPYAEPMYPSYDARLAPLPPISRMTDPLRGLPSVPSVRPRENPYPVLSPRPTASYPYSLESS